MTTDADFLADIIAHRDDDAPRLIYADWLEEQGRELRAEFIRVECRLHHLIHDEGEQAFLQAHIDSLRRRERELLSGRVEALQFPPLRSQYDSRYPYHASTARYWCGEPLHDRIALTFRRGFVAAIVVCAADWLDFADALCACAPLEEVTLSTWPEWRSSGGVPGLFSLAPRESPAWFTAADLRMDRDDEGNHHWPPDGPHWKDRLTRRLLVAEWPDLKFRLPAVDERRVEAPAVRRIPRSRRS